MEVNEIRYENFKALFARFKREHPDVPDYGALRRFGEFIGVSERQVSFLNTKHRNIGAGTARKIESAFRLPVGWMDTRHDDTTAPRGLAERRFIETMLSLYRRDPEAAMLAASQLLQAVMLGAPSNTAEMDRQATLSGEGRTQ